MSELRQVGTVGAEHLVSHLLGLGQAQDRRGQRVVADRVEHLARSPSRDPSTASSSHWELTPFRAASWVGSGPTCTGAKPPLVATTGTSTQAPCGRLSIRPKFLTFPLNSKGVWSPKRPFRIEAAYSCPRFRSSGFSSLTHSRISLRQDFARFWYSLTI